MSPSRRQWMGLTAAGLGAAAAGVAIHRWWQPPSPGTAAMLEHVSLPDLDGRPQSLGQWRNKLLVLNFWATWCEPCRDEIPALVTAQARHGKNVQIVGISVDSADKIREFIPPFKINYPLLIADLGTLQWMKDLGNRSGGLPYTVFITDARKVVHQHLGALNLAQLEAEFEKWRAPV